MGVSMRIERPGLKAGDPLVNIPLRLVGIPRPDWSRAGFAARDDRGDVPLTESDEPPTPQGVYRRWSVGRETVGDVVVSYRAPPRRVTVATNNGPLFDLREEDGGFIGAGNGFLVAPVAPGPWRIRLNWDLSRAPAGSLGVWSLGEGTVETVGPSQLLQFSYYAAGRLKSHPAEPGDTFAFYWLSDPPFDPAALGEKMRALYDSMAAFFDDRAGSYRVFVRQNPFLGTGGTGLQGLLAHEIAHTWPALAGEHGDTAWYSEGMAEFYSTVLSHRAGAISTERLLETFNERAMAYYSNPYISLSNPEAAKIFWTDPVAQTVPYGRGWMYLLRTDAAIRQASGGARSLDDVVKAMRRRQYGGQGFGIPDWLALVGAEVGVQAAKADYDHMVAGGLLTPPAGLYGPCLRTERREVREFQLGFARASLNDGRIVRDLVPGSTAEAAGLRNGDVILQNSDLNSVRKDETVPLELKLRRGETTLDIRYLPRGARVEGWRWVRDPATPDTACKF
jgi:hypothetical protein